MRILIDEALEKNPHSMEALFDLLADSGYEVKRGKNITLMKAGQKNIRLESLGEGYTEKELYAVIMGAATHTPRKNRRMADPKARLITEIEDKLNGRHSQWDSVRILKQMAQSVLYVQQHDFENFDELAAKSAAATARVNELSETMKSAEKRMAEITVLKTHIINYSKTRDVYVGYRKSGYSEEQPQAIARYICYAEVDELTAEMVNDLVEHSRQNTILYLNRCCHLQRLKNLIASD